ncbi:hypothetical protein C5167_006507 [Papaver somniferum]|uniref:Uncharacterized protein n=1 Tax=Papaver somniferum TaxID=3469 RepID=A0A4Y7JGM7_PAPSO|nr:uncharacterized protein LOC113276487 isoform X1 [Papaver somniferum]RZC59202.1 hypothetical protein C5167_006507 [Papaver somniferum]
MAFAVRFLQPIRASLSVLSAPRSSILSTRKLFNGNYEQLRRLVKGLEPGNASRFQYNISIKRKCVQNFSFSGGKLSLRSIFGVSIVTGYLSLRPQVSYAMDDEHQEKNLWGAPEFFEEDDPYTFLALVRKLWLPALLVMNVVMSWDHPFTLVLKIVLSLFSTKPSALSIYLFVEKLRHQSMREDPMYIFKSFYAKKVDVEDYLLLCLANVEFGDRKINLIGIMGSWWVLSSTPLELEISSRHSISEE